MWASEEQQRTGEMEGWGDGSVSKLEDLSSNPSTQVKLTMAKALWLRSQELAGQLI